MTVFPVDAAAPSLNAPQALCLHRMIADWADRTPDAIAIEAPDPQR